MKKSVSLVKELVLIKLKRQLFYKEVFWMSGIVNLSLFLVQLCFFSAIYGEIEMIGTWKRYQMLFFIGTYNLITNVGMMFYYFGLLRIPQLIKSGKLDLYLIKPCNPVLYIAFGEFDFSSITMVIMSIVTMIYSICIGEYTVTIENIVAFAFMFILMLILYFDLLLMVRCVSFYMLDISGLENLEWSLTELAMKLPGNLFVGVFRVILCLLVPYGLLSTIPSQIFWGNIDCKMFIYAVIVTAVFSCMTFLFWKKSMKYYRSASS